MASLQAAPAADGLFLPPPPTGPGGEDSITTEEGVRCSQSINASGGYLDIGVAGGNLNTSTDIYGNPVGAIAYGQSAIGYARVIVPLGATPKRLDCSRVYELEITKLKEQVKLLKLGIQSN